ncbi:hypothetical protein AAFF_G00262860 [Aldrovandia affinis]|uniref:Uncharacterized protein n=1 Tax=Aldrovandia affinis TaxID=143900 RepID=A0AAD7WT49_9TELE|nr:hypothetical protein AAFF_G00262860 [Aldrovandia affinis]
MGEGRAAVSAYGELDGGSRQDAEGKSTRLFSGIKKHYLAQTRHDIITERGRREHSQGWHSDVRGRDCVETTCCSAFVQLTCANYIVRRCLHLRPPV